MMGQQLNIFDSVHPKENRKFNQTRLEENREYFSTQCKKVFDLMMSGIRLTVLNAHVEFLISSLPRRSKDLSDMGVKISKSYEGRICTYFMSELDREFNRVKFK